MTLASDLSARLRCGRPTWRPRHRRHVLAPVESSGTLHWKACIMYILHWANLMACHRLPRASDSKGFWGGLCVDHRARARRSRRELRRDTILSKSALSGRHAAEGKGAGLLSLPGEQAVLFARSWRSESGVRLWRSGVRIQYSHQTVETSENRTQSCFRSILHRDHVHQVIHCVLHVCITSHKAHTDASDTSVCGPTRPPGAWLDTLASKCTLGQSQPRLSLYLHMASAMPTWCPCTCAAASGTRTRSARTQKRKRASLCQWQTSKSSSS